MAIERLNWRDIMKIAAVALVALGLASAAGSALAAQASDTDYLRASRCRGIAVGLGVDASALNAFVKAQGQGRAPSIEERADEEFARARREAHGDGKDRLSAELSSACQSFAAPTKASTSSSNTSS
jgi:hypothetical protein